jgi:hypothetical protein
MFGDYLKIDEINSIVTEYPETCQRPSQGIYII